MLSPCSVEPIFNLSRCGARASASCFPACQTGKPGQTFELAQTVWHPTTTVGEPANSQYVIVARHRFIWTPTTGVELLRLRCLSPLSIQEFPSSLSLSNHNENSKVASILYQYFSSPTGMVIIKIL